MLFNKKENFTFVLIDYTKINTSFEYLKYIFKIYVIFKSYSRNSNIILKSLITNIEKRCLKQNCPLKIYLKNLEKGIYSQYLLMNYCDNLFQYGISKFSVNINLKSNYITFLIIEMNNAKKALIILNSINKNVLSFTINYNIYLCRKLIDKHHLIITEGNCLNEYQTNSKDFKDLIEKTILLYYKFMSLLLDCKNKKDNNFQLLNKLGNQIIIKKKEIEKNFNKLIKTKTNNNEIIKLYF